MKPIDLSNPGDSNPKKENKVVYNNEAANAKVRRILKSQEVAKSELAKSVDTRKTVYTDLNASTLATAKALDPRYEKFRDKINTYGNMADSERIAAANQSGLDIVKATTSGFFLNFAAGALDSFGANDPIGMANMLAKNSTYQYENRFQKWAKGIQKNVGTKHAIYGEGDNVWSAQYWGNQLQSLGYSMGLIAETFAEQALIAFATQGAGNVATAASTAAKVGKLSKMAKLGKNIKKVAKSTFTQQRMFGAAQGIKQSYMNALGAGESTYNKYIKLGFDEKVAKQKAADAAALNFKTQAIPLMVLNGFQYAAVSGKYNPWKKSGANTGFGGVVESFAERAVPKVTNKYAKGAINYGVQIVSESLEEGIETAMSSYAQYHTLRKDELNKKPTFLSHLMDGHELRDSMIGGALGGVAFKAMGSAASKLRDRIQKNNRTEQYAKFLSSVSARNYEDLKKLAAIDPANRKEINKHKRSSSKANVFEALQYDFLNGDEQGFNSHVSNLEEIQQAIQDNDMDKLKELKLDDINDLEFLAENTSALIEEAHETKKDFEKYFKKFEGDHQIAFQASYDETNKRDIIREKQLESEKFDEIKANDKSYQELSDLGKEYADLMLRNKALIMMSKEGETNGNIAERTEILQRLDEIKKSDEWAKVKESDIPKMFSLDEKEMLTQNFLDIQYSRDLLSVDKKLASWNNAESREEYKIETLKEAIENARSVESVEKAAKELEQKQGPFSEKKKDEIAKKKAEARKKEEELKKTTNNPNEGVPITEPSQVEKEVKETPINRYEEDTKSAKEPELSNFEKEKAKQERSENSAHIKNKEESKNKEDVEKTHLGNPEVKKAADEFFGNLDEIFGEEESLNEQLEKQINEKKSEIYDDNGNLIPTNEEIKANQAAYDKAKKEGKFAFLKEDTPQKPKTLKEQVTELERQRDEEIGTKESRSYTDDDGVTWTVEIQILKDKKVVRVKGEKNGETVQDSPKTYNKELSNDKIYETENTDEYEYSDVKQIESRGKRTDKIIAEYDTKIQELRNSQKVDNKGSINEQITELERQKNKELSEIKSGNQTPKLSTPKGTPAYFSTPNNKGEFTSKGESDPKRGASLYKFFISKDGKTAEFEFFNDPSTFRSALDDPNRILPASEPVSKDANYDSTAKKIVTHKRGKAVLKDGKWVVTEKAKISYGDLKIDDSDVEYRKKEITDKYNSEIQALKDSQEVNREETSRIFEDLKKEKEEQLASISQIPKQRGVLGLMAKGLKAVSSFDDNAGKFEYTKEIVNSEGETRREYVIRDTKEELEKLIEEDFERKIKESFKEEKELTNTTTEPVVKTPDLEPKKEKKKEVKPKEDTFGIFGELEFDPFTTPESDFMPFALKSLEGDNKSEYEAKLKNTMKRFYDSFKKELGYNPSFIELMEVLIQEKGIKSTENRFELFKKGWELNNFEPTNFKEVYDDLFNNHSRKSILDAFDELSGEMVSEKEVVDYHQSKDKELEEKAKPTVIEEGKPKAVVVDFKSPEVSYDAVFVSTPFKRVKDKDGNITTVNVGNELNSEDDIKHQKLLIENGISKGDVLELKVPENYLRFLITKYNDKGEPDGSETFSDYVSRNNIEENSPEWNARLPIVAVDKDGDPVFMIRDTSWFNDFNIRGENAAIQKETGIRNITALRQQVVQGNVSIEISEKVPGLLQKVVNKDGLPTSKSLKDKPDSTFGYVNKEKGVIITNNGEIPLDKRELFESKQLATGSLVEILYHKDGSGNYSVRYLEPQTIGSNETLLNTIIDVIEEYILFAFKGNYETQAKYDLRKKESDERKKAFNEKMLEITGVANLATNATNFNNFLANFINLNEKESDWADLKREKTSVQQIIKRANTIYKEKWGTNTGDPNQIKFFTQNGGLYVVARNQNGEVTTKKVVEKSYKGNHDYVSLEDTRRLLALTLFNPSQNALKNTESSIAVVDANDIYGERVKGPSLQEVSTDMLHSSFNSYSVNGERVDFVSPSIRFKVVETKAKKITNKVAKAKEVEKKTEVAEILNIEKPTPVDKPTSAEESAVKNEAAKKVVEGTATPQDKDIADGDISEVLDEVEDTKIKELVDNLYLSVVSNEVVDTPLALPGLSVNQTNDLTNYLVNRTIHYITLDTALDKKQINKLLKSELKEYVRKLSNNIDALEERLEDVKESEALQDKLNRVKEVRDLVNSDALIDELINHASNKVEKFVSLAEEIDEDTNFEEGQETGSSEAFDKASVTLDPKAKSSAKLKRFMFNIYDRVENENTTGFLGVDKFVPFDVVYNTTIRVLNFPDGLPSSEKLMLKRLEEAAVRLDKDGKEKILNPIIKQVYDRLKNADQATKNMFGYELSKHTLSMEFISYQKQAKGGYSQKVFETNSNDILRVIKNHFVSEFRNSGLVKINNGTLSLDKDKAQELLDFANEAFIGKMKAYNAATSTRGAKPVSDRRQGYTKHGIKIDDLVTFLNEFGIRLSPETFNHLITEGAYFEGTDGNQKRAFESMFNVTDKTSGIFGFLVNELEAITKKQDTTFEDSSSPNHPFSNMGAILSGIAKVERRYSTFPSPHSFRDGSKSIYGYTATTNATDLTQRLKDNSGSFNYRNQLNETPFSQNSYLLAMLNEDDSPLRDKLEIKHLGITALKQLNADLFGDAGITSLSAIDHTYTKLGAFMDMKQGSIKKFKGMNMRMARMFFPNMSDKTQMLMLKTAVFDIKSEDTIKNGKIKPSDRMIERAYEALVESELNRIINHYKNGAKSDIKNYDEAAKLFLIFPAINTIKYEGKSFTEHISSGLVNPKDFFKANFKKEANKLLEKLLIETQEEYLNSFTDNEYVIKEKGKVINKLDKDYLKARNGKNLDEQLAIAAMDFAFNSLITNANIFQLYSGDPALYAKNSPIKKQMESDGKLRDESDALAIYQSISKDIVDSNMDKRLALLIAPGSKLANSKDEVYNQIMLEEWISITDNVLFLVELYRGTEEVENAKILLKNYQDAKDPVIKGSALKELENTYPEIDKYFEIEGADAQEYTTTEEHLDILFRQGRISQETYNKVQTKVRNQVLSESKGEEINPKDVLTHAELKVMFQPIKPVYTGAIYDKNNKVMRTMYVKSSSFPLLPQLTNSKQLDTLRKLMEKQAYTIKDGKIIGYKGVRASYQSANKVGSTNNALSLFDGDNNLRENIHPDEITNATIPLSRDNFRVQMDVPMKTLKKKEDKVSQGTQTLKLLFGDGVAQMFPKLKQRFDEVYSNYIDLIIEDLFDEMGLPSDGVIRTEEQKQKLFNNLKDFLVRQLDDASPNVLQGLDLITQTVNGKTVVDFNMPLWMSPDSNKFESLMNAIVNNRINKLKLPGSSYVAGSQAGMKIVDFDSYFESKVVEFEKDILPTPEKVEKGFVEGRTELFPGIYANEDQEAALQEMREFLNSDETLFTLTGRGGTGKTTLIKKLVEDREALFIAPTHKAKNVLTKSINSNTNRKDREAITLAAALFVKPNDDGEFAPDKYKREYMGSSMPIRNAKLIIIDEASMINDAYYEDIKDQIRRYNPKAKIIFMGDNAQIPPVGQDTDSKVFSEVKGATLNQRMRQGETSPIVPLSDIVASNVESSVPERKVIKKEERVNKFNEDTNEGVLFVNNEKQLLENFVVDFKEHPTSTKLITYNNESHQRNPQSVLNLNKKVRELLYGNNAPQYMDGEQVISYSTTMEGDEIILENSVDFTVEKVDKPYTEFKTVSVSSKNRGPRTISISYEAIPLTLKDNLTGKITIINVPTNESKPLIQKKINDLFKGNKLEGIAKDGQLAYELMGSIPKIEYGYAVTSHKAQGSTYRNAYVMEDNILNAYGATNKAKNQSLYVGISRASHKLVMHSSQNPALTKENVIPFEKVPEQASTESIIAKEADQGKAIELEITNSDGREFLLRYEFGGNWRIYDKKTETGTYVMSRPIPQDVIKKTVDKYVSKESQNLIKKVEDLRNQPGWAAPKDDNEVSKQHFDTQKELLKSLELRDNQEKASTESEADILPAQTKPVSTKKKMFDSSNKTLQSGAVVTYNNKKYILWNINNSNKAQLVGVDGTKFSGTPNLDKLIVEGNYPKATYNGTEYIVTDKGNIYSLANGSIRWTSDAQSSLDARNDIYSQVGYAELESLSQRKDKVSSEQKITNPLDNYIEHLKNNESGKANATLAKLKKDNPDLVNKVKSAFALASNSPTKEGRLTIFINELSKINKEYKPKETVDVGKRKEVRTETSLKDAPSKKALDHVIYTPSWEGELKPAEFHKDKNNKVIGLKKAQVMVGPKFRDGKGKLIELIFADGTPNPKYIENKGGKLMIKDTISKELLSITSFRIPTSSHQSMTQLEIVGFLPFESGDIMLVPKNLTTQKGLDFDVDKETTYQLWHETDADGNIMPYDRIHSLEDIDGKLGNPKTTQKEKNKLRKQKKKILENQIVRVYGEVLSNPSVEMQSKINKVLSMDIANSQSEMIDNAMAKSSNLFSLASPSHQRKKMEAGSSGKLGIGVYSNMVTFHSMVQQTPTGSVKILNARKEFTPEGKTVTVIEEDRVVFGDIVSDGSLGESNSTQNSKLPKELRDQITRSITDILAERQNIATDNVKEQVMGKVNINSQTINVDSLLVALGIDLDAWEITPDEFKANPKNTKKIGDKYYRIGNIPFLFLSQPILREYVEGLKALQSQTKEFNTDAKLLLESNLLDKYAYEGDIDLENNSLTGKTLFENLSNPTAKTQTEVFDMFMKLQEKADSIRTLQSQLNSNKGLGKSRLEASDKFDGLSNIFNRYQPGSGPYLNGFEQLFGEAERVTRDNFKPLSENSDYMRFGEVFINPTNPMSKMVVKSAYLAQILWADFYAYDRPNVKEYFKELVEESKTSTDSEYAVAEFKNTLLKEIKKFFNSSFNNNLVPENVVGRRRELFMDIQGQNESLAKYLLTHVKNIPELKNNALISRFSYQLGEEKGGPSLIKFNNSVGENYDENYLYSALHILKSQGDVIKLPNKNGKEYTVDMLIEDLLQYSLLEGGVQEAIQFIKYIPIDMFLSRGYADYFREMNNPDSNSFLVGLTNFKVQFFQNNPNQLPKVNANKISKKPNEAGVFLPAKSKVPFESSLPDMFAVYNSKNKKPKQPYDIYLYDEEKRGHVLIPTLGTFGMSEYDPSVPYLTESLIKGVKSDNKSQVKYIPKASPSSVTKKATTSKYDTPAAIKIYENQGSYGKEFINAAKIVETEGIVKYLESVLFSETSLNKATQDHIKALIAIYKVRAPKIEFKSVKKGKEGNTPKGSFVYGKKPKDSKVMMFLDFNTKREEEAGFERKDFITTFIHELTHEVSSDYLGRSLDVDKVAPLENASEVVKRLSMLYQKALDGFEVNDPGFKADLDKLRFIMNKINNKFNNPNAPEVTDEERRFFNTNKERLYPMYNILEFMAEFIANENFRNDLDKIDSGFFKKVINLVTQIFNALNPKGNFTENSIAYHLGIISSEVFYNDLKMKSNKADTLIDTGIGEEISDGEIENTLANMDKESRDISQEEMLGGYEKFQKLKESGKVKKAFGKENLPFFNHNLIYADNALSSQQLNELAQEGEIIVSKSLEDNTLSTQGIYKIGSKYVQVTPVIRSNTPIKNKDAYISKNPGLKNKIESLSFTEANLYKVKDVTEDYGNTKSDIKCMV